MIVIINSIIEKFTTTYQTLTTRMGRIPNVLEAQIDFTNPNAYNNIPQGNPQRHYLGPKHAIMANRNHNVDNLLHQVRHNLGEGETTC